MIIDMNEQQASNIFLRGDKGIGKSTLIDRVLSLCLQARDLSIGGIMTFRNPNDERIYITKATFPRDYSSASLIGDYKNGVIKGVFDVYAEQLLNSVSKSDIIILDELGFLEQDSILFQNAVITCLESNTPVIGVLKNKEIPWYCALLERNDVTVFNVTVGNRAPLANELIGALIRCLPAKAVVNEYLVSN